MSFDPVWEQIHTQRAWGRYPPIELVRFVATHYAGAAPRDSIRFLEAGCGAGANVWYLAREGFTVTGIDGSEAAIRRARAYLSAEGLEADLRVGDLTIVLAELPDSSFDCVVDIGCYQCHRLAAARALVAHSARILKPGGRCFSLLHARGSEGDGRGHELEPGTYTHIEVGQLMGLGINHFYTEPEARDIFDPFADLTIDVLTSTRRNQTERYVHLLVTGRKGA